MAIIMPKEQGWGGAIGEGLGSGLQALMNSQISHMKERRAHQKKLAITQSMGLPEEYANLDEQTLGKLVQQAQKHRLEQPGRMAELAVLSQLLGGQSPTNDQVSNQEQLPDQQTYETQQPQQPQAQLGGQDLNFLNQLPSSAAQSLQQDRLGKNPLEAMNQMAPSAASQALQLGQMQKKQPPRAPAMAPNQPTPINQSGMAQSPAAGPQQAPNLLSAMAVAGGTGKNLLPTLQFVAGQQKEQRAQAHEQEKRIREDEEIARKETDKYSEGVVQKQKAAKEDNLKLAKMDKLIDQGKLPNATLWGVLTKLEDTHAAALAGSVGAAGAALGSAIPGAGTLVGGAVGAGLGGLIGAAISPLAGAAKSMIRSGSKDIEEFEKLSADFVKNAKLVFAGKLTDADLDAYMKTIPTLMQTDAGKKQVISNLRSMNDMAEIEAKAMRDIIRQNNGKRPLNLEQQVQDAIADDLDKLAKKFLA